MFTTSKTNLKDRSVTMKALGKKVDKSVPPEYYMAQGAGQINAGQNTQGWYFKLWHLGRQPSAGATDGSDLLKLVNLQLSGSDPPDAFVQMYKNKHYKVKLTNQGNAIVDVYIYDLICVKDIDYTATAYNNLTTLVDQTLLDYQVSGTGYTATTKSVIGADPWKFPEMNKMYRKVKSRKITLNPGQVHTHLVNVRGKSIVDGSRILQSSALKGFSHGIALRTVGYPCNDNTVKTTVGMYTPTIDVWWQANLTAEFLTSTTISTRYVTNVLDPINAMTTAEIMNDDAGVGAAAGNA